VTRIPVVIRRVVLTVVCLVPAVAQAQWGPPTSPSPGPRFVWVGQWAPCDHPLATNAGLGCVSTPVSQVLTEAAPSASPGPNFVWTGQQWVPCDHPLAIRAGLGCVSTPSSQVLTTAPEADEPPPPPVQDEWIYTEAYTGVGTRVPVLARTSNPDRWFVKGGHYAAPYADFRMTILDRVRLADGNWAWIGQITQSGGTPQRGTILSYPLYGDRGMWLTEQELATATETNAGLR
jgi:hypothetical protein